MPTIHLTKSIIDQLSPGPKDIVYWDHTLSGFGLKITPKGRKVFIILYRTCDGLAARLDGKDPAAEKRQQRRKIVRDSVEDVAAEYLQRHVDHLRSSVETKRILDREVLSRWSGRSLHDIGKHDVLKLVDEIVDRGSIMRHGRSTTRQPG